jgi:hypothetical protein
VPLIIDDERTNEATRNTWISIVDPVIDSSYIEILLKGSSSVMGKPQQNLNGQQE